MKRVGVVFAVAMGGVGVVACLSPFGGGGGGGGTTLDPAPSGTVDNPSFEVPTPPPINQVNGGGGSPTDDGGPGSGADGGPGSGSDGGPGSGSDGGPGSGTPDSGATLVPGGAAPIVPAGELPLSDLLACRNGPEAQWNTSLGSLAGFNACKGSLAMSFGPVVLESGVAGSNVSVVPGAPSADVALDCGPGCALAIDETLVAVPVLTPAPACQLTCSAGGFTPSGPACATGYACLTTSATCNSSASGSLATGATATATCQPAVVTLLKGHAQTRFGWSPGAKNWVPEPYVYANLVGLKLDGAGKPKPVVAPQSPSDFDGLVAWVVYERDGSYTVYKKSSPANVFRISERNDALTAMDKENSPTQPAPMFGTRGQTVQYVRVGPTDALAEVRDFRYPGLKAVVFDRDPVASGATCAPEGACLDLDLKCVSGVATFDSSCSSAATANFGRVVAVHHAVVSGVGTAHYKLGYDGTGRLASVAEDASDPNGTTFRSPTTITYAGNRIDQVTDPFGDPVAYTWDGAGRLQTQTHAGPSAAETERLTFAYSCGGAACTAGAAPTMVTETDEDGFANQTLFTAFPSATNPLAVYTSQEARGTSSGGTVTIEDATKTLMIRDGTGYQTRRYTMGDRTLTSWNTDGRPARSAQVMRVDTNVDVTAMTAALPSKSIAAIEYTITKFDGDNMPTTIYSPIGITEITYQKSIHAADDFRWAGQMTLQTKTTELSADTTTTPTPTVTTVNAVSLFTKATAANAADAPTAGTACAFEGECLGLDSKCTGGVATFDSDCGTSDACAHLYTGDFTYAFQMNATMSGGATCSWLDKWLRPVASLGPGDGSLPNTIVYHAVYGLIASTAEPALSTTTTRQYDPGGYLKSEVMTTCGNTTSQRTFTRTSTESTTVETVGTAGPKTTTTMTLEPTTGRVSQSEFTAEKGGGGTVYSKTSLFTYAPNSNATVRRLDKFEPTGSDEVDETTSWHIRGYADPAGP